MLGQLFQGGRRRGEPGLPPVEFFNAVGQGFPGFRGEVLGSRFEEDALPGTLGAVQRFDLLVIEIDLGSTPILLADGPDKHGPNL